MKILGIETSCDETAAAVVENGTNILSSVVASSLELHAKTGGIIPEEAAREQVKSILPVIEEALQKAFPNSHTTSYKLLATKIDAIAVTVGPGLIGSLLVGVETAKTLSFVFDKPIIPVNHLVAHIYANFVSEFPVTKFQFPVFPALCLVVSGGHTDLVLMKSHGQLAYIGGTRDDAAGEAFDKCSRLLGLSYPGGPAIAKEAEAYLNSNKNNSKLDLFPRPLIFDDSLDFSFSGLKTAVAREVKDKILSTKDKQRMAAEVQEAIVDTLISKTLKAVEKYQPKSLLISGGVAANFRLREKLQSALDRFNNTTLFLPDPKLCTDNAAVIASAAFFNNKEVAWKEVSANPELTITS